MKKLRKLLNWERPGPKNKQTKVNNLDSQSVEMTGHWFVLCEAKN